MPDRTTLVVQRYLDVLNGDERGESQVRELLDRAAKRLHQLCSSMLRRSYPRLARPPLNLDPDELLSAVVERLLKAMRVLRPASVRQFFGLASKHMRWELNDLARRLDQQPRLAGISEVAMPTETASANGLSPHLSRILQAIEALPEDEREAFNLVRVQGLSHGEAAELLEVSTKTVQRRLNRSLVLLVEALGDIRPAG